jgi:hypothetical protein
MNDAYRATCGGIWNSAAGVSRDGTKVFSTSEHPRLVGGQHIDHPEFRNWVVNDFEVESKNVYIYERKGSTNQGAQCLILSLAAFSSISDDPASPFESLTSAKNDKVSAQNDI